jgi:hypothetical protein
VVPERKGKIPAISDKPVLQKLLLKPGNRFLVLNAPKGYYEELGALPDKVALLKEPTPPIDVIQVFVMNQKELEDNLKKLKPLLTPKTILWLTYLKGTAKLKTNINRDTIRSYAESLGLIGVFIFSVNDDWSAIRLKIA